MQPMIRSVALIAVVGLTGIPYSYGQAAVKDLAALQHDRVYTFLLKDGSCKFGELAKSDKQSITIRSGGQPDTLVPIVDILQFGQGPELFLSLPFMQSGADTQPNTFP